MYSNSNKTSSTPKSNKKMKAETKIVKETPKKKSSQDDDDEDPDVIDSPAFDALEKRKEKAENYGNSLLLAETAERKIPAINPFRR
jgi:replication factor C subunit 1